MVCVLILTLEMDSGVYIGDVLRREGYEVRVVDPHSQPEDVKTDSADCLVLDVPGASAPQLVETSKRDVPQRPVLVVSAAPRLSHVLGAFEAGADGYMRAPYDPRELAARLHALVRRRAELTGERRGSVAGGAQMPTGSDQGLHGVKLIQGDAHQRRSRTTSLRPVLA